MSGLKRKAKDLNVRMFLRRDTATFRGAHALLENINRNAISNLPRFKGIPPGTCRWLKKLSDEEKARLTMITNAIADVIYCQCKMWKNYRKAGDIVTNTVVAYPAANKSMPAQLEYVSKTNQRKSIRVIDTSNFKGLGNVALAFDEHDVEFEQIGVDIVERVIPRGKVVVLNDFPQRSDTYDIDEHSQILGMVGRERYIQRIEGPWIGPIVRSYLGGNCMPPNESIVLYDVPTELFGVLIELLPEEPEKQAPEQLPLVLSEPAVVETVEEPEVMKEPKPKELDPEAKARLRKKIVEFVVCYSRNLNLGGTPPLFEVGEFANIADNRELQESLREFVGLTVSMEFNNQGFRLERGFEAKLFQQFTVSGSKPDQVEINRAIDKICRALGIPDSTN
jgi:hypothetical protein